mgnify:CR=1 FL=1
MSLAGVLLGLSDVGRGDLPILGVRVSDRSPEELLDRRAPGWRKTVTLVAPTSKYEKPASVTSWRGIRLDPPAGLPLMWHFYDIVRLPSSLQSSA